MEKVFDVAVVGAGIAGMSVAHLLSKSGLDVVVLEKARGTGGRLSSKRWRVEEGESLGFDLGAPSFASRTQAMKTVVNDWFNQGWLSRQGLALPGADEWVPVSRSSALTRQLSEGSQLLCGTKVSGVIQQDGHWVVRGWAQDNAPQPQLNDPKHAEDLVSAKQVVLACPAEQTCDLLPADSSLLPTLRPVLSRPQFVFAMAFNRQALETQLQTTQQSMDEWLAPIKGHDWVHRVSVESEKPGRAPQSKVVVTVALEFGVSETLIQQTDPELEAVLSEQGFQRWVAAQLVLAPEQVMRHRWLYSRYPEATRLPYEYLADGSGLWVCGDYLMAMAVTGDSGVESAFLSGHALACELATLMAAGNGSSTIEARAAQEHLA